MTITRKRQVFAQNLRKLCDAQSSISAVCRDLSINRQQFGKYLAGSILPSADNMRRICRYFDIDINDIFLEDLQTGDQKPATPFGRTLERIVNFHEMTEQARNRTKDFAPKNGYYMAYNMSYATNHQDGGTFIMCNITKLLAHDGLIAYRRKHIQRGKFAFENLSRDYYGQGIVSNYGLYIKYTDYTDKDCFGALILKRMNVPMHDLAGVNVAVASTRYGIPAATRVYLRYIAEQPNLRHLGKKAGLWEESEIDDEIADVLGFLKRPVEPNDMVLRAF